MIAARRPDGGKLMARPIHFEIHAENTQRAIAFYKALSGMMQMDEKAK
jgi:predicted enzyme related to lactoylglutathione lyase